MKIFLATGNKDKFDRMSRWMNGMNLEIFGPFDLPKKYRNKTAIPDKEEKKYTTMKSRAIAKAEYAANALKGYDKFLVLAMDDIAYFPTIDTEIIDLRSPQDIYDKENRLVIRGKKQRMQGLDIANFYSTIVKRVVIKENDEMKNLGYKFMPIVWKFALAKFDMNKDKKAEIICLWDRKNYIRGIELDSVIDNGYVMDNIVSEMPDGEVSAVKKGKWVEKEPVKKIKKLLE